ncbi:MAG TPA: TonB-dependent receptor [Candidatus Acidoferrum sp.]|nr:TonB-dependent receptor [Candidatus Acidoferrum sp.]
MRKPSLVSLSALLCWTALSAIPAAAQTVYGSIVGTVTDASGAIIPGANITLANLGTNEQKTTQSGNDGNFVFVNLLPGAYNVTVEKTGFKRLVRQQIAVEVQSSIRIDAALQVGETSQTMEVTAETPLLQTQEATLGQVVEGRQVVDMPLNGRNVLNLIALVPGVVPQGATSGNPATANVNGWGNYQIGGGAANQSAAYIDGAPINVSYVNGTALVPTQEAVQEFRVATNDVSPEFGRFAGGIVNMSTRSGTNAFHGSAYEFLRNTSLNANNFFNNRVGTARPAFKQNQFGVTAGGPAIRDKTFFFISYEGFIARQGTTNLTTTPTAAMRAGDFSAAKIPALFDPLTTTLVNGVYTRTPFAGNQIPANRLNPAAINLANTLWPLPNQPGVVNNYQVTYARPFNYNQYNARIDHRLNAKQQLFARTTWWHKNYTPNSALQNSTGTGNVYATHQFVAGDTYTINPTTVADFRASFLRFSNTTIPITCCNYNLSAISPQWGAYQNSVAFAELPEPNVVGMYNFNTIPVILNTDNSYSVSGSITKTRGAHTLHFGGEARRIEWYYAQSNSPTGTFNFDSGFTSQLPLASGSTLGSPGNTGYGFASWMLGFPSSGSAQAPALSGGVQYYYGLYLNDSWRVSRKLTVTAGLRWEQPGSFGEKHGNLTTLDLSQPQPDLSKALGRTVTGGLALVNSDRYGDNTWQSLHWKLFSPRVGVAYSVSDKIVIRSGYGISYLPNVVAFSLGPYNSPVNNSITNMTATLDGGLTPNLATTLSNPFPNGITPPPGRSQAYLNSLIGQGIGSPMPNQRYPYAQQWNLDAQYQAAGGLLIDVGYAGAKGTHLPLYSVNLDQIPDQYLSMGSALLTQVPNPFFGIIPQSAGVLGQPTVAQGYLLKPYPQYLYVSAFSPTLGDSTYKALQVKVQKRMGSNGTLLVSYTRSRFEGSADVLSPWLEANRFGVGGAQGVQDNYNIAAEKSLSSFDLPNRFVLSYVLDLPFGKGKKFLGGVQGPVSKVVSGWAINGITTFQNGFPLAFIDASNNTLVNNFAVGNAGPGTGAGITRPNFATGCDPTISGPAQARLGAWFKTSCYSVPGPFEFGNEPRVSPMLRAQGVNNFDFSVSKRTDITERMGLEFRAEFFNLFNRVQFAPPNTQPGAAQFGQVTAQYNQPRLVQFALRLRF